MPTSYRPQKLSLISGVVAAFIAKLIEQTAPLTEFDVSNLLSHLTANAPRPTVDAVAVLRPLMAFSSLRHQSTFPGRLT